MLAFKYGIFIFFYMKKTTTQKFLFFFLLILFIPIFTCPQEANKSQKGLTCPICNSDVPIIEHNIGIMIGKDSDFMPHYQDGNPPLNIQTCPQCKFSGYPDWFTYSFSASNKDFFLNEKPNIMRFKRDIGREPNLANYPDRCTLAYYASYLLQISQTERMQIALKTSYAYRADDFKVDDARNTLLELCGIKILAGNITLNFDFDLIGKTEAKLKEPSVSKEETIKALESVAILYRYHGENQKALFYIKNLETTMANLPLEQKKDDIKKLDDLKISIKAEQEFQRYALAFAFLALKNKEISAFDLTSFFFTTAELNRRLNNTDLAEKYYLIAQKFSMPDKSELLDTVDQQAQLVGIDINPQNTPIIYQYIFIMLAILLYGYVEFEGKATKEFNEWRRRYYFKRASIILLIAAFMCIQGTRVYLTTITAQVSFLLAVTFFIFSMYIIRANLQDDKYFPIVREKVIPHPKWQEFITGVRNRLEEKFFDLKAFIIDESQKHNKISSDKIRLTIKDHIKVKINLEIEKGKGENFVRAELIPMQPIIMPGAEIKNLRRLFRYILGEEKKMPAIKGKPLLIYFLIPLLLAFIIIRAAIIIKPELMIYLPHHFFILYPMFITAGLIMTLAQIIFRREHYVGIPLTIFTSAILAIAFYLSLYILKIYGV